MCKPDCPASRQPMVTLGREEEVGLVVDLDMEDIEVAKGRCTEQAS